MTNRDKIRYLKQYIDICKEHEEIWDSYHKFLCKIESPKQATISGMPISAPCCKETMSAIIARKEQFAELISSKAQDLLDMRIHIENVIGRVQDETEQRLLRLRYLDGLTFEEISVKIMYSWKQTHRLHSNSLKNVYIEL